MTAAPYLEMLGAQWPSVHRIHLCSGCLKAVVEMAKGCWVRTSDQSAQCPAGGWHTVEER